MKKIASVLEWIIGIVLACCLFLGGLGFVGFVVAFCAGGDTAAAICEFLSKTYYVYLIKASTITVVLSFVLQYINGEAKWKRLFSGKKGIEESSKDTPSD